MLRDFWLMLGYGALCLIVGIAMGFTAPHSPPLAPAIEAPLLLARVEALEAKADAMLKARCLNVTTDKMDLAIFPVERLGKMKMPSPKEKEPTP